jgi:hypothetical protein
MPTVFCDLNFIVTAHQGIDIYKQRLLQLSRTGAVTFVLSPMHWAEAAEDRDPIRATAKADFMDSLKARWIYERRSVQGKEVAAVFFRFLGVDARPPQMLADLTDVVADLAGVRAERNSRDFVAHLRGVGPNHPLARSLQQAFDANQANGDRFRSGQLAFDFLRRMEKLNIGSLLPERTPAAAIISVNTKTDFLERCSLNNFPAVTVESLATYDAWRENRQMNRNNFMDQQHLVALPYVDFFLTDDAGLIALITRISQDLPFPIATVLRKADFDARFPG